MPEDHLHPRVRDPVRDLAAGVERRLLELEVGELHALEILERQHPHARVVPVDLRHDDDVGIVEVAPERVGVPRLELVVELLADEARELVDEVVDVDEVERAHALPDDPRRLVEQREVVLDLARRVRALHLDDDGVAVRQHRAVDLPDRRRGNRRLAELEERLLDRQAELVLDHLAHLRERKRRHVVLEAAELGDDVRRHDVGPRREQLAELDERRAELVEHLAQVPARAPSRRPARVRLDARRPRQQVGQLVPLEEVAEPVPDRDLRDLGEPADLARARSSRHRRSVPRGERRLPPARIEPWTRASCSCSSAASWPAASSPRSALPGRACRCCPRSSRSGCCSARTGRAGSTSTTRSSPVRSASSAWR